MKDVISCFHATENLYLSVYRRREKMCLIWLNLWSFSDLDLNLSPTGKVVKRVGDSLPVVIEKAASGDVTVSWTKVKACARCMCRISNVFCRNAANLVATMGCFGLGVAVVESLFES